MNTGATATPSYGFFEEKQTIGASTYQRISMRVKLSANVWGTSSAAHTEESKHPAAAPSA